MTAPRPPTDALSDDELSRIAMFPEMTRCGTIVEMARGWIAARARLSKLEGALVSIAHTFTEDSHGNMKTYPASYYQDIARAALAQPAESGGKEGCGCTEQDHKCTDGQYHADCQSEYMRARMPAPPAPQEPDEEAWASYRKATDAGYSEKAAFLDALRAARASGMERAAKVADGFADNPMSLPNMGELDVLTADQIAKAIRREAAR